LRFHILIFVETSKDIEPREVTLPEMIDWSIFVAGCFGAAAPEMVRLYKGRNLSVTIPRSYFGISVLFFLLGGFVAVALPTTTLWGAFYAGVSLPIIVSSAGKSQKRSKGFGLHAVEPPSLTLGGYLRLLFEYPEIF